jgi:hypothetical protein
MTSKTLFTAVALATLSFLSACGGGAADDGQAQASDVGGIGGSGVTSQGVGGIGGSGVTSQGVGGIGGSGVVAQDVGGIGGSGVTSQSVGGIGGSGVVAQDVGGIGGSGITAQDVGGIGGSGIASVASVSLKACSLRSVNVTIAGARVNQDATADAGGAGWIDVALASPERVNLLTLSAGGTLPLDMTTLPDGTYRQMRLLLVADGANAPLADSIVTSGRAELALSVPSAAQGGLPLSATVTVAGGQVSASYANVDACAGVSATGGVYALGGAATGATRVASAY